MSGRTLQIRTLTGDQVAAHLDDVARLRIAVFRDWPYLYEGDDPDYERRYLASYAQSPGSVFVLAVTVEGTVVGAATGMPLADDDAAFQQPFHERGLDVDDVFYCGESVLLPAWRGQGVGHRFFDEREAHARRLGKRWSAFCRVERTADDPRRPPGHRDNDVFWRKRGYAPQPDMHCHLDWNEVGRGRCPHRLRFWMRELGD